MLEAHILSGGIDSVSVLHRRLIETNNEIHVLHLMTFDGKAVAQLRAARKCAIWLARTIRPFTYREIEMMAMTGKTCSNNIFAQCGFALGEYIVRNPGIGLVVQGSNGGAADLSPESRFRNRYREAICAAVCDGYAPKPTWLYPHQALTKAEVCRSVPAELLELCWTCNYPKPLGDDFVPCGECDKCLDFIRAKEAM